MNDINHCSSLILCGGRGTRLGPNLAHIPKVLAPVNGRPMLSYILENFRTYSFERQILATGNLSSVIEEYIAQERFAIPTVISNAGVGASMLQRIYQARDLFSEYTLVSYGDTLIQLNFNDLYKKHLESQKAMTMVTGKIQSPFGIVHFDDHGEVQMFKEKPSFDYYIGCMMFHRRALDWVTADLLELPDGAGLVGLFHRLIADHQMNAYPFSGAQLTFNTEAELADAQKKIKVFYTLNESANHPTELTPASIKEFVAETV